MQSPLPRTEPAAGPSPRDLRAIRDAARRLTPVVVDPGPGQPRFHAYMCAVRGRGRDAWLHLSPIAAGALPPSDRVTVRCTAPETPLALSAPHIERVAPNEARVPLEHARVWTMPPRRSARRRLDAHEPLTLVIPGGVQDADVDVLPISDLSAEWLMVDAGFAIEPGTSLDAVEILGPHGLLRRVDATVSDTQPWYGADGSPQFRCRMRLSDASSPPRGYDVVDRPDRVRNLLELATLLGAPAVYRDPDGDRRARLQMEPAGDAELAFTHEPTLAVRTRSRLTVSFELFSISYEMSVRVLRSGARTVVTSMPLLLRRRRRRQEGRAIVPAGRGIDVELRNPAARTTARRRVLDLSFGGLCFEVDPGRDLLWRDLTLGELRLHDEGTTITVGDARVRHVRTTSGGTLLCHAALTSPNTTANTGLRDLLEQLRYPSLQAHDGQGLAGPLQLYRDAGLLSPFMENNLASEREQCEDNWRAAHQRTDACRTLVRVEDGRHVAATTALHAWDGTWLGQHLAALPGRKWKSPGSLLMAYIDHVLLRPDCRFMCFFAKEDNERMSSIHEAFQELTGTSEVFGRAALDLWMRPGHLRATSTPAARGSPVTTRLGKRTEPVLSRAAERSLGSLPAHALCMVPGAFGLPVARRELRRGGLERSRSTRVVWEGRTPRVGVLHEYLSPGVNLTNMLSASWLVPIDPTAGATHEAVDQVCARPSPFPSGDRFAIVPAGFAGDALRERGFRHTLTANLYAVTRTGLRRYAFFLAQSYGEVAVRRILRQQAEEHAARENVA